MERIFVIGKSTAQARTDALRDPLIRAMSEVDKQNITPVGDGDYYRLAGIRNMKVLLTSGFQLRKDWAELQGRLRVAGAFMRLVL